jgi:hypothetical protein
MVLGFNGTPQIQRNRPGFKYGHGERRGNE